MAETTWPHQVILTETQKESSIKIASKRASKFELTSLGRILAPSNENKTDILAWGWPSSGNVKLSDYSMNLSTCSETNRRGVARIEATIQPNSAIKSFSFNFNPYRQAVSDDPKMGWYPKFQAYLYISESKSLTLSNWTSSTTIAKKRKYWNSYGSGKTADAYCGKDSENNIAYTFNKDDQNNQRAGTFTFTSYQGSALSDILQNTHTTSTKTFYIYIFISINVDTVDQYDYQTYIKFNATYTPRSSTMTDGFKTNPVLPADKFYTTYLTANIQYKLLNEDSLVSFTERRQINTDTKDSLKCPLRDKTVITIIPSHPEFPQKFTFVGWSKREQDKEQDAEIKKNFKSLIKPGGNIYNSVHGIQDESQDIIAEAENDSDSIILYAWWNETSQFWMFSNTGRCQPPPSTSTSTYIQNPWSNQDILLGYQPRTSGATDNTTVWMLNSDTNTWIKQPEVADLNKWYARHSGYGKENIYANTSKLYTYAFGIGDNGPVDLNDSDTFLASPYVTLCYQDVAPDKAPMAVKVLWYNDTDLLSAPDPIYWNLPDKSDDIIISAKEGSQEYKKQKELIEADYALYQKTSGVSIEWSVTLPDAILIDSNYLHYRFQGYTTDAEYIINNGWLTEKIKSNQNIANFNFIAKSTKLDKYLTNLSLYSVFKYTIPSYTIHFQFDDTQTFTLYKEQEDVYFSNQQVSTRAKLDLKYEINGEDCSQQTFEEAFEAACTLSDTYGLIRKIIGWEHSGGTNCWADKQGNISFNIKDLMDTMDDYAQNYAQTNTSDVLTQINVTLTPIWSEMNLEEYSSNKSKVTINLNGHLSLNHGILFNTRYTNVAQGTDYSNNYRINNLRITSNGLGAESGLDITVLNHSRETTNNKTILMACKTTDENTDYQLDSAFNQEPKIKNSGDCELYAHGLNLSDGLILHNIKGYKPLFIDDAIPTDNNNKNKGQILFIKDGITDIPTGWVKYTPYIYIPTTNTTGDT